MIIQPAGGIFGSVSAIGEGEWAEDPPLAQEIPPMYIIAIRVGGLDEVGDGFFPFDSLGHRYAPLAVFCLQRNLQSLLQMDSRSNI